MLKIKWIKKIRPKKVLERTGAKREIRNMFVRKRVRIIGHNLTYLKLLAVILEGLVEEKERTRKEGKEWVIKSR